MSTHWSVVIPSDRIESLRMSVRSALSMHANLRLSDVVVVTREIENSEIGDELSGLTWIRDDEEKFNFARRINLGFDHVGDRDLIVMCDDVEVLTRDAFDIIGAESDIRIVAPSVKGRVGPYWQSEAQNWPEVPFVSFICVYLSAAVRQTVGRLDESIIGYGYEDTEYCFRARRMGFSCGVSGKVTIEHTIRIKSNFVEKHGEELPSLSQTARKTFLARISGTPTAPAARDASEDAPSP